MRTLKDVAAHAVLRTEKLSAALLIMALLAHAGCAAKKPTSLRPAPSLTASTAADTNATQVERAALREGVAKYENKDFGAALDQLQTVIDSPAFSRLDGSERHTALYLAGTAALQFAQSARAHALLIRASEMEEATVDDWLKRGSAAWNLADHLDSSHVVIKIARRWPEALSQISESFIFRLTDEASKLPPENAARFDLPDALFQAQWKPARAISASAVWKNLALVLLERGAMDQAMRVASQIDEPYMLISMRVDKRFEPVVKADPKHFDIDRALAEQTARFRAALAASPRSLGSVERLARSLLEERKYRQALHLVDGVLGRIRSAETPPYDDAELELPWVMNERAEALEALGRWDEAIDELKRASRLHEYGGTNVSQTINLAALYCRLDRPREALAVLPAVAQASPYGWMQVAGVRVSAAIEMHDYSALGSALAYLREHQVDAESTLQGALTRSRETDDAARILISRLEDSNLRAAALLDVQEYAEKPATPREKHWRALSRAVLANPEVKASIARVGKVERFNIAPLRE